MTFKAKYSLKRFLGYRLFRGFSHLLASTVFATPRQRLGTGKSGHDERGLFPGRISRISKISKFSLESQEKMVGFWGFSKISRISKFSRISGENGTFLKDPFSKRPLLPNPIRRPLGRTPKAVCCSAVERPQGERERRTSASPRVGCVKKASQLVGKAMATLQTLAHKKTI